MVHLYLVRGVPGAGKTTFAATLAKALGAEHRETDFIRDAFPGGRPSFPWNKEQNYQVHRQCLSEAAYDLATGRDVVVSNTFYTLGRLEPYFKMAKIYDATVTVLHVQGRHGTVHDNVDQAMYEDGWEEYKGEFH